MDGSLRCDGRGARFGLKFIVSHYLLFLGEDLERMMVCILFQWMNWRWGGGDMVV